MLTYLILFFLTIPFSIVSALVGLGGGIFIIPLLILLFDLPIKLVAGTMLLAMIPYTAVATFRNVRAGYVNFPIGFIMQTAAILGVILGANYSTLLPEFALRIIFFLLVLYLIYSLQLDSQDSRNIVARVFIRLNQIPPFLRKSQSVSQRTSIPALLLMGGISGIFSGLLGVGGGFLNTPVLIIGVGLMPKTAVGTAVFMIIITASVGGLYHSLLGHVDYRLVAIVGSGMIFGALWGTSLLKSIPEQKIKKIIITVLLIAAVLILFR